MLYNESNGTLTKDPPIVDALRPTALADYIGQARLKRDLFEIRIPAAKAERRPLDHVLLCATPGAGKTTLAALIAAALELPFESLTMPVSLKTLCRTIQRFDGVLLLDEIHRCSTSQQEQLLTLLLEGYLQTNTGQQIDAGWLTIVGATTERWKLIEPLIERFPIAPTWADYTEDELTQITLMMARKAHQEMTEEVAMLLGRAAAGTPRRARQFVLAYRDLACSLERTPTAAECTELCETESDGLSLAHVKYLEILDALGGAKGLKVLCSLLRMNEATVTELERLLINKEFIIFGDAGRQLTKAGFARVRPNTRLGAAPS